MSINGQQIVLASSNAGKLHELQDMLAPLHFNVIPQGDFNLTDADETGLTFVENAIIKARHACDQTKLPAIADDSGLEVDALDGKPGIYSARFGGEHGNDQRNNETLLTALAGIEPAKRRARYQCVLVFMRHSQDPTPIICQGSWEGRILESAQGDGGFGYDPLFWVEDYNCSAAELPKAEKNRISHRARALQQLLTQLKAHYPLVSA